MDSDTPTDAIPTYDEAFPLLPELDDVQNVIALAMKASWAVSRVCSSQVTQVFTIACEELKEQDSFGKSQSIFKNIADVNFTTISRSISKDKSVTITISGKKENVQAARRDLQSRLQTQVTHEVAVPKELHRFIIGFEGKILKGIEESTGTKIKIPGQDLPKTTISVFGTIENVMKAEKDIMLISDEKAKMDLVRLKIMKDFHALIAGAGNGNIKAISEATAIAGANNVRVYFSAERDEISVAGEKPAVAQAVLMINQIYETLRKTCGQTSVQVKKSQHRYIIGPKGSHITEIMQKTGVAIAIPPQDDPSDMVILRGPQSNLQLASQLMQEKANSHTNEIITIPEWLHKHVIGKNGANLKAWKEHSTNTRVDFNKDGLDAITLDGPPDEVSILKAAFEAFAGELAKVLVHVDKKVDPKYHPHLIGKKGAIIVQLREQTRAEITFVPKDKPEFVRIVGNKEAVEKAEKAVQEIVQKQENMRTIDLVVPHRFHSNIIGAKGATIKSITELFPSLSINMPKDDKSEIIVLRGDKKDVDGGEKHVKAMVKQFIEDGFQLEVPVFKEFHRKIIGRAGSNVKLVEAEFTVRIRFPEEESENNNIVITGKKKNTESARDKILAEQAKLANIVTEHVEIDAKYHGALIGVKGRILADVTRDCGNVNIRFPSKGGDAKKANLVDINGPKEDVLKAKARLLELGNEQILSHHTEEVSVKREFHKVFVGRGGLERQKFEKENKVRIIFPKPSDITESPDDDIITLIGKKEACAAAKEKLLKRVKDLETTVEADVEIESVYFKEFFAFKGKFLKDTQNELRVQITIPKADDKGKYASEKIHLKGPSDLVPTVIAQIKQIVDDVKNRVTVEFQVPANIIAAIVVGMTDARVSERLKVYIKLPERNAGAGIKTASVAATTAPAAVAEAETDPVDVEAAEAEAAAVEAAEVDAAVVTKSAPTAVKMATITVTGLKASCDEAKAELLALIPVQVSFEVNSKHHFAILGEGGSKIQQLSKDTNCRISLPKRGGDASEANLIVLRGSPSAVDDVKARLAAIVVVLEEKSFQVSVDCNHSHFAAFIGKAGATIKAFQTKFNVTMDLKKDSDSIVLTGYQKDVEAAAIDVKAQAKDLSSRTQEILKIDPRVHPMLIGKGAVAKKAVEDKYKVKIFFPNREIENVDLWKVVVNGSDDGPANAAAALESSAADFLDEVEARDNERKEETRYTKDTRQADAAPKAQEAFAIRNAPWEGAASNPTDFPSLGKSKPAVASVWGKKV